MKKKDGKRIVEYTGHSLQRVPEGRTSLRRRIEIIFASVHFLLFYISGLQRIESFKWTYFKVSRRV